MSRLPLYFSLAALFAVDAHAVRPKDTPAETPAEKPAERVPGEKVPEYVLKNHSSFGVDKEARTPFWPIGWDRSKIANPNPGPKPGPVVPVQKFTLKDKAAAFTLTSVMGGNPPLALINGQSYGEGEFLPVYTAGGQVRIPVVVKAIRDGSVVLEHEGEQLTIAIKRDIIVPRQPGPKVVAPMNRIVLPDK